MGYISNFIVYTLAMLGVIILALFVFKYTTGVKVKSSGNTRGLKVTETLSLSPRKTLYVVETAGERFLRAGDTDRTTLISKLEGSSDIKMRIDNNISSQVQDYSDRHGLGIHSTQKSPYGTVMKDLAEKIKL